MNRSVTVIVLISISAVWCVGCGSAALVPVRLDQELLQLKAEAGEPAPYKVTIAPIELAVPEQPRVTPDGQQEFFCNPQIDTAETRAELGRLMMDFNVFREVADPEGGPPADVFKAAYNNLSDLVVRARYVENRVSFVDFTGGHVPNMFLWFLFAVPSWFVDDELFKAEVALDLDVIDAFSREVLFSKRFKGVEERALDDFDRGWKIFGIFRAPDFFRSQNWEQVTGKLMPFADKQLKTSLLRDMLAGDFAAAVAEEGFQQRLARTAAVVAGISRYTDTRITPVRYASSDAALITTMLTDRQQGGGINPLFVKTFRDQRAVKSDIMASLHEVGTMRCGPADTFIFYFAGFGYLSEGSNAAGYLLPADADLDNLESSAIAIADLQQWLRETAAGTVIFILDTSFSGPERGRALQPKMAANSFDFLAPLTDDPRVRILLAASLGESAYSFDSLQHGLFSYFLSAGVLDGTSDMNLDQEITLSEVYLQAKNNLIDMSGYKGQPQNPVLLGEGNMEIVLRDMTRVLEPLDETLPEAEMIEEPSDAEPPAAIPEPEELEEAPAAGPEIEELPVELLELEPAAPETPAELPIDLPERPAE